MDCENEVYSTLETIPQEMLLEICSYLDAKYIDEVFRHVCKRFKEIFQDESVWKFRLKHRSLPNYRDKSWINYKEACIHFEEEQRLFRFPSETFLHFCNQTKHHGIINDVHFMNNGKLCATGGRDADIVLWDTNYLFDQYDKLQNSVASEDIDKRICKHVILQAHRGWVWSLSSIDQFLFTTGWDGKVKKWDLESNLKSPLFSVKYKSPVLSSSIQDNLLICGTYDHKIHLHDHRAQSHIRTLRHHIGTVLNLATHGRYLISNSSDKTVRLHDLRTYKLLSSIKFESTPLSMSLNLGLLWVGDHHGNLHFINPDVALATVTSTHSTGYKVNDIKHSWGCVLAACYDRQIRIYNPCETHNLINTIEAESHGELTCVDLGENHVLAAASANRVHFWIPKKV